MMTGSALHGVEGLSIQIQFVRRQLALRGY